MPEPSDTHPRMERFLIEGYRCMAPVDKLKRVAALNRALDELATARIKDMYGPDISERELRLRLAALTLDRETMIKVCDWDPVQHGY